MRYFAMVIGVLALAACDTAEDLLDSVAGSPRPVGPKISGDRVAILSQETSLEADDSLSDTPISLAVSEQLEEWPQHSGSASGYATTLALGEEVDDYTDVSIGEGANFEQGTVVSPVVGGGHIFAMDAEGKISAHPVDEPSSELWVSDGVANSEEDPMIGGGLTYDRGIVFAVSGHGLAAALDAKTGRELWRQDIRIPVRSAPLVAGGRMFVVTADSKAFALDSTTGNIVWEDQGLSEGASFLAKASPIFHNGLVAVPYASAELKILTADEGKPLWGDVLALTRRSNAAGNFSGIGGAPVIHEGALYAVSTAGVLAAYRLDNGLRIWEQPVSSSNRPWVSGNAIYVLASDGQLVALNRFDGRIYWVSKLPAYENEDFRLYPYHWAGPVLAGETLYIVGSHGALKRFNAISGEELEEVDIPSGVLSSPVIAGGAMYLVSQSAELVVLK